MLRALQSVRAAHLRPAQQLLRAAAPPPSLRAAASPLPLLPEAASSSPSRGLATRSELAARALVAKAPFPALTAALFDRIERGVAGMRAANAGFAVERTSSPAQLTLRLGAGAGDAAAAGGGDARAFHIVADDAARTVSFAALKTGQQFTYRFDPSRPGAEWVGVADGHQLLEMLARELVYHAKGFPDF